jgi:hypothetical protein
MHLWTYDGAAEVRRATVRGAQFFLLATLAILSVMLPMRTARAQGCIIAHSSNQVMGPETEGGYLAAKHWEITVNGRHQYSFRHFVGPVEQEYRLEVGNQVENKINLFNFDLTYQATDRWSFSVNAPLLFATRRSNSSPVTMSTQGLGDTPVSSQVWLWKPTKAPRGNIAVGFGVQFPTGRSDIKEVTESSVGGPRTTAADDYSIQPGIGGWGIVLAGQGFRDIGKNAVFYADGSYLITPQDTNGIVTGQTTPLNGHVSISDEYLAEAGIARPIGSLRSLRGLALTFGPRIEGVPAHDLIGSNDGFRRPGFAISIVPGLQYARQRSILSFQVGKAMYRDRVRSYPDIVNGGHGDAAFADYLWLASYTYRF